MTEKELLDLKQEIDEAKTTVSQLKGRKDSLMEQLEKDWGCTTIAAAEKKIKENDEFISKLQIQIKEETEALEELLNIN